MNFKKMELFGFKSFADKVQVNFNSGVTGIVGPNGCGKSNVADAVRWVLGEQSAKMLRGSSMQDVIFNGTEARKSQSFAEVSLTFDNTSKIFNVDFDEVVISRKLYRSGESEYAINHEPCRLKDIAELLRDSGLGKESYSIIGQGRIDEILSAKPEDRRNIFEEAAGISKLKYRKTEAERKLEHTHDNMVRILDILHELEIQIGPLKEQSETAKKYLEFRDRLRALDINNYLYQYDSSTEAKAKLQQKIQGYEDELTLKNQEFEDAVNEYNSSFNKLRSLDDDIEALRDELLNLTVGLEKQAGESMLLKEKMSASKEATDKLNLTIEQLKLKLEAATERIEKIDNELKAKKVIVAELARSSDETTKALTEVQAKISAEEQNAEANTAKLFENIDKIGDCKAKISAVENEIKHVGVSIAELTVRKKEIIARSQEIKAKVAASTETVSTSKKQKAQTEQTIKDEKQNQLKLAYKKSALEDELLEETNHYHSLKSRLNLLIEMQKENEGYQLSIRKILEASKTNSTLAGKFVGTVAKLMKTSKKYECAIEMALGASVQNIVTKNENDAKYIIEFLKAQNFGRATFMPLTAMKERSIAGDLMRIINATPKCCGVALDLIEFDSAYKNVFSSMLGSTVIVEDIDTAVRLAKECRYSFKIVTLDGDIINPQGTMSGGSRKAQGVSLIGREREIKDTNEAIKKSEEQIEVIKKEIAGIDAETDGFADKLKALESASVQCDIVIAKESQNLSQINIEAQALIKESAETEANHKALEQTAKELKADLASLNDLKAKMETGEKITDYASSANLELKKWKIRRDNLTEESTELKVKLAGAESEIVSLEGELFRLKDTQTETQKELDSALGELNRNYLQTSELESKLTSSVDKTKYEENLKKLQKVRDALASKDGVKDELSASLTKIDDRKLVLSSELQRIGDKKAKEENNLTKIDSDLETMQNKVWEDYGLTYASACDYRETPYNLESGLQEASKLKRQIASLGDVNVNAIDSYKQVGERFEDLSKQKEDLEKAEANLKDLMNSLMTEMQTKFTAEFNKINQNFQSIFRELFGGGRAELILTDPNNSLECGIDIVAEPTGKKLQNITLLSGGEKALTAIAILFAILKLKPMPFCILDEIEAALDDANVERFAKYLKRFSNYTQFIVITHRKPTMELADCLYGVTMEERGVSKIVSVQLSEALKNSTKGK